MAVCNARILGEEMSIRGTDIHYHKTLQCSRKAFKKITIDDGDAFFMICSECLRSYMTKGSKKETWLGWFDCSYPASAKVEHSPWFYQTIRAHWDSQQNEKTRELYKNQAFPPSWCREYVEKLNKYSPVMAEVEEEQEVETPPPKTRKQELEEKIEAIQAWMKGEGKLKFKEQPKKLKELFQLRVELKMVPR